MTALCLEAWALLQGESAGQGWGHRRCGGPSLQEESSWDTEGLPGEEEEVFSVGPKGRTF